MCIRDSGMTLHRQAVSAAPTFFVYLARILVIGVASWLAASGAPLSLIHI